MRVSVIACKISGRGPRNRAFRAEHLAADIVRTRRVNTKVADIAIQ